MSTVNPTPNPYAPPRAPVADVNRSRVSFQPVKLFSSQGRVGRMRYLAHSLVGYLVFGIAAFGLGALLGALRMSFAVPIVTVVVLVPYLIFVVMKTIQRSHDMDWSGWTCLLAFIPFVGLVWIFKGGSTGSNSYGAPPQPNNRSTSIVVTALIAVVFIGIVAAVSIPAYQQYTLRAKAAQAGK
jgi:uncharacterized membrane protein YhaH (DUF805 family)